MRYTTCDQITSKTTIQQPRAERQGIPGIEIGLACCMASGAGSVEETACVDLRTVNDAQAARIAQLEAELRACRLHSGALRRMPHAARGGHSACTCDGRILPPRRGRVRVR